MASTDWDVSELENTVYGKPMFAGDVCDIAAEEQCGAEQALARYFDRANIKLTVEGSTEAWQKDGQAVLLAGDHSKGVESLALLALMGNMGRSDSYYIGLPFSASSVIRASIGAEHKTLPVIPRTMAADRGNKWNRHMIWRLATSGPLPTTDQINALNHQTITNATDLLEAGNAVTIFPSGGVNDADDTPWQSGIGKILSSVSAEKHESTQVVLFKFEGLSRLKLMAALSVASFGVTPPAQNINLVVGEQGTIQDMIAGIDLQNPRAITDRMQQHYTSALGE